MRSVGGEYGGRREGSEMVKRSHSMVEWLVCGSSMGTESGLSGETNAVDSWG